MSNKDTKANQSIPQQPFEQEPNGRGKSFLTVILMVILIGTGIYAFLRGAPENNENDVQEQIEQIREEDQEEDETTEENESNQEDPSSSDTNGNENDTVDAVTPSETVVTAVTEENISVQATNGDGVTHLARRAIQERLQSQEKELSAAQRIYAETVLTQNETYYQDSINPAEEISFSTQDIDSVIDGAENLSPSQIDAWNVYVPNVPSLQ